MADPARPGHVAASVKGTLWRIGGRDRPLKAGDFVKEGQLLCRLDDRELQINLELTRQRIKKAARTQTNRVCPTCGHYGDREVVRTEEF